MFRFKRGCVFDDAHQHVHAVYIQSLLEIGVKLFQLVTASAVLDMTLSLGICIELSEQLLFVSVSAVFCLNFNDIVELRWST